MIYSRICKFCEKNIFYNSRNSFNKAKLKNYNCASCSALYRPPKSEATRMKISLAQKGRKLPKERAEKARKFIVEWNKNPENRKRKSELYKGGGNPRYGKQHSKETIKKLKENHADVCGNKNPMFGNNHSDESRRKIRESIVKRIQEYGIHSRNFNPKACKVIDEFGNRNGYHFQHALNGGEITTIGYFLDGYDKDKNVVIEVDESYHNKPSQKEKDVRRQKEITDHLKCEFIRIPFNKDCVGKL